MCYHGRRTMARPSTDPVAQRLRALFSTLKVGATAHCKYPKPPLPHAVIGWVLSYKGVTVRTYFSQQADKLDLLREFEATAREKGLLHKKAPQGTEPPREGNLPRKRTS